MPAIITQQPYHDVLVIGAGLAGITAAIAAAEQDASVGLISASEICAGSSFCGTTWGVGFVTAQDDSPAAIDDFCDTICHEVGQEMADPFLVRALVEESFKALDFMRAHGLKVLEPSDEAKNDKEYIPCFDHAHRGWHGIATMESVRGLHEALEDAGVDLHPSREVVNLLVEADGRVCGAVTKGASGLEAHPAGAVILATGGMSALFDDHLSGSDADGTGAALALLAGASLTNIEFLQQMTAYKTPGGLVVFNEKLWDRTRLTRASDGADAFEAFGFDAEAAREALGAHAGHGPYTTARPSRLVETVISAVNEDDQCLARVDIDLEQAPEFVRTYAGWLKETHGVDLTDEIPVVVSMQASNGGIVTDEWGATEVPCLYAAGECTGGWHGADRIGGLASAAAITQGMLAGRAAAWCGSMYETPSETPMVAFTVADTDAAELAGIHADIRARATKALVGERNDVTLEPLTDEINDLVQRLLDPNPVVLEAWLRAVDANVDDMSENAITVMQLLSLYNIAFSANARTESRGPHGRTGYEATDSAFAFPLTVKLNKDRFKNK